MTVPHDCPTCRYGRLIRDLMERTQDSDDKKLIEDLYDRLIHAEDDGAYWRMKFNEVRNAQNKG